MTILIFGYGEKGSEKQKKLSEKMFLKNEKNKTKTKMWTDFSNNRSFGFLKN
jgi:hypothetical protein